MIQSCCMHQTPVFSSLKQNDRAADTTSAASQQGQINDNHSALVKVSPAPQASLLPHFASLIRSFFRTLRTKIRTTAEPSAVKTAVNVTDDADPVGRAVRCFCL